MEGSSCLRPAATTPRGMIFVNDKKYAWYVVPAVCRDADAHLRSETCIKGHRSSSCQHTERALFEIKKKGRPVTQCDHCRELRKTKQVHVRCSCDSKPDQLPAAPKAPGAKKGSRLPAEAAYPHGLSPGVAGVATSPAPPKHTGAAFFLTFLRHFDNLCIRS
ncbi:hypothetical protein FS749_007541 [Ceratobasidium sp. UAMH 11750]|nr:hypothetical protein FS749_007541 [Ceratobasidium sp. UAMH 11750]